ncbi:MAG TPA: hypothetical protein VFQ53_11090 [Kofleriaceae bacterium]|nr:hypothetical protein [Kofleriaceae bacterium]
MRVCALLVLCGCQIVFPLDGPGSTPDAPAALDAADDGRHVDDAPPATGCAPVSFDGTQRAVMYGAETLQHFSVSRTETYVVFGTSGLPKWAIDSDPNQLGFESPSAIISGVSGSVDRVALAADDAVLMVTASFSTSIATPVTPPAAWRTDAALTIGKSHRAGRPMAGGVRVVVELGDGSFEEWARDGTMWLLEGQYTPAMLTGEASTLIEQASLSDDGLRLVYRVQGGNEPGIHVATRNNVDTSFVHAGRILAQGQPASFAPQLTSACQHLWVLENGALVRYAQP